MAFVFRSQSKKEKPIKTEDILHTNEKIEKELLEKKYTKNYKEILINSQKHIPNLNFGFSSSSKKEPSYYYLEKNPGPGTYDPKFLNNINEEDLDDVNNNENNKLFISREKRFKGNEYTSESPGPGKYYKDFILLQKHNSTSQKESGILYKKSKKYTINSRGRKVTIPSKGTNFGYSMDKKGDIKLERDPHKNMKFNGTIKDSVGPGYYSIENSSLKKNNAHDWSKDKEGNNIIKKNNENNIKEFNTLGVQTEPNDLIDYYKDSPPYSISSLNSIKYNNDNKTNVSKKEIKVKNIINKEDKLFPKIKIKYTIDTIDEDSQNKFKDKLSKKSYINTSVGPGPGKYKLVDDFDKIVMNKQNQNFGSNKNRGLIFPMKKNIIKLGINNNNIYESFINATEGNIIRNQNKNSVKENNYYNLTDDRKKNDNIHNLVLLKVKGIKDQYINNKNEINSRRGPGTYNPQVQKKIFSKKIQNFGSVSKRFDSNIDNDNKTNSIILLKDKNNKNEKHFQSQVPQNILKRNINGLSFSNILKNKNNILNENRKYPPVGIYSPEKKLSIEYEAKMLMKYNERSPGFGEGEKRFYEKENNENENLGVGCYNILTPFKKFGQRKVPFIFSIEKDGRGSMIDYNLIKKNAGPEAYRYNDKNDWNKKSFNKLFS